MDRCRPRHQSQPHSATVGRDQGQSLDKKLINFLIPDFTLSLDELENRFLCILFNFWSWLLRADQISFLVDGREHRATMLKEKARDVAGSKDTVDISFLIQSCNRHIFSGFNIFIHLM